MKLTGANFTAPIAVAMLLLAAHAPAEDAALAPAPTGASAPLTIPAVGVELTQPEELIPSDPGPPETAGGEQDSPVDALHSAATDGPDGWGPLRILGGKVAPGSRSDLYWTAGESFAGSAIETPITVIRGVAPGPTLCLAAAVHGDELNGVEIVRRTLSEIDENKLHGTVIGAPIVNLLGFSHGSRYLPDRRDLNRYFPGQPTGSSGSRIAFAFFSEVIRHCERLVDFHTGSFKRTNLPQLRANLHNPKVREFITRFGATSVLHKVGYRGTLRNATTEAGIPAVTFELGAPGTLQLDFVRFGVKAIDTLLGNLGMLGRFRSWTAEQPIFYRSRWVRAYRGGILTSSVQVGTPVRAGDVLGRVINPITNEESEVSAPVSGRVLGRALDQFVLPGFAVFHIGVAADNAIDSSLDNDDSEDDYANSDVDSDDSDATLPTDLEIDSVEGGFDDEMH